MILICMLQVRITEILGIVKKKLMNDDKPKNA